MTKVAKIMFALAATSSIMALGATSAEAQRRNRNQEAPVAPATPPTSDAFRAAYVPLQTALSASNWAAAEPLLPAAQMAAVNEYERYLAARADYLIATGVNNQARRAAAVTAMINSNGILPVEQRQIFSMGAQLAYNNDDYAAAATRSKRAIELGATDDAFKIWLVDSLIRSGQLDQAVVEARAIVTAAQAAGGKAPELVYTQLAAALNEADRRSETVAWLTERVAAYPSPTNFRNAALIYLDGVEADRGITIDTLRLVSVADGMNDRRYYIEYAASLAEDALPNAALRAIAAGRAANVLTEADLSGQTTLALVKESAEANLAADRTSLAGTERSAATNPGSRLSQRVADGYLSYDNFAKAEELYTAAKAKTGADLGLLDTRIGITRYLAGNTAGAIESFNAVEGVRAPLAKLWIAFIQSRSTAVAPAAPAAAPTPPPAG